MHNTASRGGVGEMLLEQVLNIAGTGWRLKIKIGDAGDAGEACKKFVTTFWSLKVDQVGLKKDTAGELALRTRSARSIHHGDSA